MCHQHLHVTSRPVSAMLTLSEAGSLVGKVSDSLKGPLTQLPAQGGSRAPAASPRRVSEGPSAIPGASFWPTMDGTPVWALHEP
jgi:hypothetical protein